MALARKHGKNPQLWNDVAPFILRLSQPQYYNDPVVRYGYLRGEETYGYVTSIRERWQRYRAAVHGGTTRWGRACPVTQEFARRIQKQSTECRRTGSQVQTEYAITHDGRDSGHIR